MKYKQRKPPIWLVSEAKSQLSEVLHKARTRGPQIIGSRNQCVVVSRDEWNKLHQTSESLGSWLVQNSPGIEIPQPERGQSASRTPPFNQD